jgi:hypothetical protein
VIPSSLFSSSLRGQYAEQAMNAGLREQEEALKIAPEMMQ